jgi:hypothetical protein
LDALGFRSPDIIPYIEPGCRCHVILGAAPTSTGRPNHWRGVRRTAQKPIQPNHPKATLYLLGGRPVRQRRAGELLDRQSGHPGHDLDPREGGGRTHTLNAAAYGLVKTRLTGDASDGNTASIEGVKIKVSVNSDLLVAMKSGSPLGRVSTTAEEAGAVFLCLPESDCGHTLVCSGGLTGI